MPITVRSLTAPGNSTDQASYTTGSITPGANKLILDWVSSVAYLQWDSQMFFEVAE